MFTVSRTLNRTALGILVALGAVAGSMTAAEAHYYTRQCDRDGDDCVTLRCDNDGDDCRVVSRHHYTPIYRSYYNQAPYHRGYYGGDSPSGVYLGFGVGPRYGHAWHRHDDDDDD